MENGGNDVFWGGKEDGKIPQTAGGCPGCESLVWRSAPSKKTPQNPIQTRGKSPLKQKNEQLTVPNVKYMH